ncbi:MAG: hypothetical protein JW984_13760 [Deltaproteobacteria bacterium]|uniref:Uncharacterized protein n=1 Tax=Candidatus Zymogenus saltonus TaxID=2844893 RepID=A0A9D8KHL1_9DELT|nr:hypothetical protein [Candidatus Zymogenus saltonus]
MSRGGKKDADKGTRDDKAAVNNVAESVDIALEEIRYIREVMEGTKDFFISGWSGIAWGVAIIIGVMLTERIISHPPDLGVSKTLWVLWIIVFTFASGVETFYFFKGAKDTGRIIISTVTVRIFATETVMSVQGLILTLLLIHIGFPSYIPGAWLLILGAMMFVAGLFFPGGIWVFGGLTFVASIIAFIMPEMGLVCLGFGGAVSLFWGLAYLTKRRK